MAARAVSCHYQSVQSFKDHVRTVVSRMTVSFFERDKALALYPVQQTLDQLIERDRQRFANAVKQVSATKPLRANR